jgi:hypothetical protein
LLWEFTPKLCPRILETLCLSSEVIVLVDIHGVVLGVMAPCNIICGDPYFERAFVSNFTSVIKMGAAVSPEMVVIA